MGSDMNIPTEMGSMSMDIDDGVVSSFHSHPSAGQTPPGFLPTGRRLAGFIQTAISHPPPDCRRFPSPDDSSQLLMQAPSPSSMIHFAQVGGIRDDHGLENRHRDLLSTSNPSAQDVTPRKRKRTGDMAHTDDNDIPHDDALPHSRSRRRRPRLRTRQDGEFTPLLIMSPATGSSPEEDTISMFHYPPPATSAPYPIQRYFAQLPPEHGPRILPNRSLPAVDDPEGPVRADSASSFAAVALAALTTTTTRPPGRLSTLHDFPLPRPFDESPTPSSQASIHVHARGLDVPLSFLSLSGPRASRAPHDEVRLGGLVLEPPSSGTTIFLDKPLCDSPGEIGPEEGLALAIRGARVLT